MPDFDPNEYLKKQSQSNDFDPNMYLEENPIEKKNPVGNGLGIGTATSKSGFAPFQTREGTNPAPYVKPKVKPKTISEAVEDDNNYLGAMYNNLIGAGTDFIGGMTRLIAKSNPYGNPIMKATADVLGNKAEQVAEKLRSGSSSKKYEEGVMQGFDLTKGVFTKENAKALPLMISRFAGDMGLAIPTAGVSYLAQGYSQGLKEFDKAVGNRTTDDPVGLDNARELFAIVYSTISSVADRYSLGFMTKSNPVAKKVKESILKETVQELATKATGKITADVIEETASRIAKKGINKFKSVGLKGLASAGVEGGTEGVTGVLTDVSKFITDDIANQNIFNKDEVVEDFWKNRLNEFAGGAVLGGITGGALRGMKSVDDMVAERVSSATNKENLYEIASELKQELSDRYNDGSLDADRRYEIGTNLTNYIKATESIPFDIGAKKRKEAIQSIVERDRVAEAIKVKQEQMKASDESLALQAQQEIDILEAKKQSLNDNIVEATADEKFKYSKDTEKDKWYKQLGEDGELEEISKQQYELETQSVPKEKAQEAEVTPKESVVAEALTKAETDLETLKQVSDKVRKYDASLKRLTDAKNAGTITENEFNGMKSRFDDVMGSSAPAVPNTIQAVKNTDGTVTVKNGDVTLRLRDENHAKSFAGKLNSQIQYVEALPEVDVPEGQPTEELVVATTLKDVIDNYEQSDNSSFNDLVNSVEQFADQNADAELLSAVEKYKKEKQEDFELAGRGDMEAAEKEFINVLNAKQNAIQEQTTNEIPLQPETAVSAEVAEGVPGAGLEVVTKQSETIPQGEGEVTAAFDLIEQAKRTKKTEKGKMEAGELAITNLGDVGKKAIFIDNNFKDIVSKIRTLKDQKGEPFVKIDCT